MTLAIYQHRGSEYPSLTPWFNTVRVANCWFDLDQRVWDFRENFLMKVVVSSKANSPWIPWNSYVLSLSNSRFDMMVSILLNLFKRVDIYALWFAARNRVIRIMISSGRPMIIFIFFLHQTLAKQLMWVRKFKPPF